MEMHENEIKTQVTPSVMQKELEQEKLLAIAPEDLCIAEIPMSVYFNFSLSSISSF